MLVGGSCIPGSRDLQPRPGAQRAPDPWPDARWGARCRQDVPV